MQKEFYNPCAIAVQVLLKIDNRTISSLPHFRFGRRFVYALGTQKLRMHPGDQHLLIIGTIEYTDFPAFGQNAGGPPQKIMSQLLSTRRLEAKPLAALWVDT